MEAGEEHEGEARTDWQSWPVVGGLPVNSCQCCVLCRVRYAAHSKSESAANHEPTRNVVGAGAGAAAGAAAGDEAVAGAGC